MKPNSYAISKKSSVSNARTAKNTSPLERKMMNNIVKKVKNSLPQKKSINLTKTNNNNQVDKKESMQRKNRNYKDNLSNSAKKSRGKQRLTQQSSSPIKKRQNDKFNNKNRNVADKNQQNLKEDYVYGTQKKYFPFNPIYTPSGQNQFQTVEQDRSSALTSQQSRGKFEKSKQQIKPAKIDLKRKLQVQLPKKEEKESSYINISPKKYSRGNFEAPSYCNYEGYEDYKVNNYLQRSNNNIDNNQRENNNNSSSNFDQNLNNNSFSKNRKINSFNGVATPQTLAKSSQNSTIPQSPHPLKTLTPAQKDVMNKYLTGNRNLQLGFEKFQKRQQFFQMSSSAAGYQPPIVNNNDRDSIAYNLRHDTQSKKVSRQHHQQPKNNYLKDDLYVNNNNNRNNNFEFQKQRYIQPPPANQIDIEQQRMQQKLDEMLQNTRNLMYHNQ